MVFVVFWVWGFFGVFVVFFLKYLNKLELKLSCCSRWDLRFVLLCPVSLRRAGREVKMLGALQAPASRD